MGLLVDSVYCMVLLFVFCDCSHQASANIAERVQLSLLRIDLNTVDLATRREIELFLKAIHLNPPKVSLQGYSVVNRELVSSELDYEISIPEFICDKNHDINEIKSDTTTIGLSGEGKLNFKLSFKQIKDPCKNNQRCNLIVWKVIRDFEKYLNNYPYAQSNSIEFKNSMLVPGLKYIIDVYVTQGKTIKEKQFSFDFVDNSYTDSRERPLASISLIGSPSADVPMPYILNAKINICFNISDYYIEWKLLDDTHNSLETFSDRGPELNIPAFTFQSGKQYFVKGTLVKMENDEIVTNAMKSINVKNNAGSLIVKLPMIYTTMNIQQPINIKPYIVDLGNNDGDMNIEWFCIYNSKNICENKYGNTLNIEAGFSAEGDYNISIKVTKGSMEKSAFSVIKIEKDVPSIEIDTVPSPILPSLGLQIRANVVDLRTFCSLQWKSEEGPYSIDLNNVPGHVNEPVKVIARRDLFLKELEEFSNDISNKEHDLLIPPPTENWEGLPNKDENYKLRFLLEAKCPKVQLEENNVEIEYSEDILNDTVTVTALVEVDVNVEPKLQPLKIEPLVGVALETVFTFQTQEAVETGTEKPYLYKFGYVLGDRKFVFCQMLDYMRCETILPYIESGVKTFLEVCNSFGSCGKVLGPIVDITLPEQINENNTLRTFKEKMNAEDFYKAFGYALTVLFTSKAMNEEESYMELFCDEVLTKIRFLLKYYNGDPNWAKRANKLIRCIGDFNKELLFSDDVLNKLVELRSKLLGAQKENLISLGRKLLAIDKVSTDLDNFKSYIEVSDLIITSSKDHNKVEMEKLHLREKIKQYIGGFCMELYQTQKTVSLEFNSVILVVEEFQKKSYNNYHVIPFNGNSWRTTAEIKLNMENIKSIEIDKLCIAKVAYKDFYDKMGVAFEVSILDGNDGHTILEDAESTILMPFDKFIGKTAMCLVYKDKWRTDCHLVKLISDYAQCSCPIMGIFYLDYEVKPPIVPITQGSEISNTPKSSDQITLRASPNLFTISQETTTSSATTEFTKNLITSPGGTPEPRIIDTSQDSSAKFPATEPVEMTKILTSTTNSPITTFNSSTKKSSSSYSVEATSTGTESPLLTNYFTSGSDTPTTNKIKGSTNKISVLPYTVTTDNANTVDLLGSNRDNTISLYVTDKSITDQSIIFTKVSKVNTVTSSSKSFTKSPATDPDQITNILASSSNFPVTVSNLDSKHSSSFRTEATSAVTESSLLLTKLFSPSSGSTIDKSMSSFLTDKSVVDETTTIFTKIPSVNLATLMQNGFTTSPITEFAQVTTISTSTISSPVTIPNSHTIENSSFSSKETTTVTDSSLLLTKIFSSGFDTFTTSIKESITEISNLSFISTTGAVKTVDYNTFGSTNDNAMSFLPTIQETITILTSASPINSVTNRSPTSADTTGKETVVKSDSVTQVNGNNEVYVTSSARQTTNDNIVHTSQLGKVTLPSPPTTHETKNVSDKHNTNYFPVTDSNKPKIFNGIVSDNVLADIVSYILISASLMGLGVLYYAFKKLFVAPLPVHDICMDNLEKPKYAKFHDEDLLK